MTRRLVADGQVFQTPAWHRGMGKYSLELLAALAASGLDVEIVLSTNVPDDPAMLAALRERVPRGRVVLLDLQRDRPGDPAVSEHNRRVLDEHLRPSPEPVEFLVLSAMQGGIRPVFPTLPAVTRSVLVYDLIPLMFHDAYLRFEEARTEYRSRLGELLAADRFLTISKTVANDLALFLGVDAGRIASIDGAPIQHSPEPEPVPSITGPFVLMPTGNDMRKNNRRAIRGFDRFNQARGGGWSLVITSTFRPDEVATLSALAPGVVFTGNLSGAQLADLYRRAAAVLFPPEYEGLGLPILEAIEASRPVACSDIAVFREISDSAFQYFDPQSILEIADAVGRAVDQTAVDDAAYAEILGRYTWPAVAAAFRAVIATPPPAAASGPRPRVTVVGPDPACDDGPGRMLQDAHAELARHLDLSYALEPVADERARRVAFVPHVAPAVVLGPGVAPPSAEVTVHHLADSPSCALTLFHALADPDVLVLHDTVLDRAWAAMRSRGLVSGSRAGLEQRVEALCGVPGTSHLATLICSARGVVVFDEAAASRVRAVAQAVGAQVRVEVVPAPVPTVVYPEVLPHRRIPATPLPVAADRRPLNADFRAAELLSRSRFVTFAEQPPVQLVLEAMRFGTVPCLPGSAASLGLPSSVCLENVADAETAVMSLLEDPAGYAALSERARTHVEARHRERDAAAALAAVVRGLTG